MQLSKTLWGEFEAQDIYLIKLQHQQTAITVTNFGAIVTRIEVTDKTGQPDNIVLGYDTLQEYIDDEFYVGCIIGRFAGRIDNAGFTINGELYQLAANDGNNVHLHGGKRGFGKRVFEIYTEALTSGSASVTLYYRSQHMEESYPGNLDVWVTYTLTTDSKLSINYRAVTDQDTHVNLTNHSYFNLSGGKENILGHQFYINADKLLVTDERYIPTGEIVSVADKPYAFNQPKQIADSITGLANGFNECYVFDSEGDKYKAAVYHEKTGRELLLETDMPALLFYTGDYLHGKFSKNAGLCLETQYFPDTPNHSNFPITLLKPGEEWTSFTSFTFRCR